jgi:membrane protein DedA with SNARE-associated domain
MDSIAHALQGLIRDLGYPGLFLLIVLESTAVPIPSLLIMPFAGYLASKGELNLAACLCVNAAGAASGSGLSYLFGAKGGDAFLRKWGKWFLIRPADIDRTHVFFEKYGARTIFIARFLPVVRHIISIPAGIARMPLPKFFALTVAGATTWGGGLMVLGYELGAHWEGVIKTWKKIDLLVAGVIAIAILVVAIRFIRRRRSAAAHTTTPDAGS